MLKWLNLQIMGGPKKAAAILISLGTALGAVVTISFQKAYKHFLSKTSNNQE